MIGRLKRWRRKGAALKRLYDEVVDTYEALKLTRARLRKADEIMRTCDPLNAKERATVREAIADARGVTAVIFKVIGKARERLR